MSESDTISKYRHILFSVCILVVALLIGFGFGRSQQVQPEQIERQGAQTVTSQEPDGGVALDEVAQLALNEPQRQFIRISKNEAEQPKALETAIARYRTPDGTGPSVTLIAAVHVADKEYFSSLNEEFRAYDALLYELVAQKGSIPDPKIESADILSSLQRTLAELLAVSLQLQEIDYQPSNFVHADLSMPELLEEGRKRGESQLTLLLGILADVLRANNLQQTNSPEKSALPSTLSELLFWLSNPSRMRLDVAQAMTAEAVTSPEAGFTTLLPYLIDARNSEAMRVLDAEIKEGREQIGIFYGAAHLADLEARLYREYGMHLVETRWLNAWDLQKNIPRRNPMQTLLGILRNLGGE